MSVQVWTDPEGFRRLRFPDFMKSAHEGGNVVSPTNYKIFLSLSLFFVFLFLFFLLEAESTQGP